MSSLLVLPGLLFTMMISETCHAEDGIHIDVSQDIDDLTVTRSLLFSSNDSLGLEVITKSPTTAGSQNPGFGRDLETLQKRWDSRSAACDLPPGYVDLHCLQYSRRWILVR